MPAPISGKWKAALSSRWFLVGGLVAFIILGSSYLRAWYQEYQIRQEISRLQAEAGRLESKKIETLELLKYVASSAYVEKEARTGLNLTKEGENMAIIARPASPSLRQDSALVIHSTQPFSNPGKWWRYFIH